MFTRKFWQVNFYFFCAILSLLAMSNYPGSKNYFIVFSAAYCYLFERGLRFSSLFELYLSSFLWLGFWAKTVIILAFTNGHFVEPVGSFDYSGRLFDQGLLAATIAAIALILASIVRARIDKGFNYTNQSKDSPYKETIFTENIKNIYFNYRGLILSLYILTVLIISILNLTYGFYQRGLPAKTILPFGLNGIINWLISFGFCSISALLIYFEAYVKKNISYLIILIALLETAFSSISLLSRGMIFNVASLSLGVLLVSFSLNIKIGYKKIIFFTTSFILSFLLVVITVQILRIMLFSECSTVENYNIQNDAKPLFINRWVGIEGMLAVTSYNHKGLDLWRKALGEKYQDTGTSFYDIEIANSHYQQTTTESTHFVTLPGIIAFLYYPGSYVFLLLSLMCIYYIGWFIEKLAYICSFSNTIFTSVISLAVASRFAHFGYVPLRSYLLFGTILANILLVYLFYYIAKNNLATKQIPYQGHCHTKAKTCSKTI